ncbi:hypothetical protein CHS0354_042790 [Potamilus streckersoni]|uniref:CAP-Gly domain-containing protein n=1 Tax=Potamilus streckersoni TaxID=2493646 RepID=A0AAE0T4U3_9BIVA|nr:hypothetical protein CHS0354_042790 [Potamilus streckersoni]
MCDMETKREEADPNQCHVGNRMNNKLSFAALAKKVLLDKKAEDREKEKQELKSKLGELEEYKVKYEKEKEEKKSLQVQLTQVTASQGDSTKKLLYMTEIVEKLRQENKKKSDQIEKYQRDISHMEDRIRNLEIRASEVEKAELILETTKQNLESANQQVRARESEIRRLTKEQEDLMRKLEGSAAKIAELEEKTEDLKFQVRHELMKNDGIEKNLETIPRLKETIEEKGKELKDCQHQIEEKTALLTAARKAVREYKDKLRDTDRHMTENISLREELEFARCEVATLKKLMMGKDYLVFQKSKALDVAKDVIEVLNETADQDQAERIRHLLESNSRAPSSMNGSIYQYDPDRRSPSPSPGRSKGHVQISSQLHYTSSSKDIDVNIPPYALENGHQVSDSHEHSHTTQKYVFLNKILQDPQLDGKRPIYSREKSAVKRTASMKETHKVYGGPEFQSKNGRSSRMSTYSFRSDSKVTSKYAKPQLELNYGVSDKSSQQRQAHTDLMHPKRGHSLSGSDSDLSDISDLSANLAVEQEDVLSKLNAKEKDDILSHIINMGNRVLFNVPQKPPKYGKRKAPKPIIYTGIVKFLGRLDPDRSESRVHLGVRLDEPVGDTDGRYKGKRLMYTPSDQGKFFRITDVTSVMDVKTGRYVPVKKLMVKFIYKSSQSQADPKHGGSQ